jgi:hypothetical protein
MAVDYEAMVEESPGMKEIRQIREERSRRQETMTIEEIWAEEDAAVKRFAERTGKAVAWAPIPLPKMVDTPEAEPTACHA